MKRVLAIAALGVALGMPVNAAGQTGGPPGPRCSPAPVNCAGWYAVDVGLSWNTTGFNSTSGCEKEPFWLDGVHSRLCLMRNVINGTPGPWTEFPATIRIDKTPPAITAAAPSRGPDANGWYRSPVAVTFFGTDRVPGVDSSGVARCSSVTYGGPDAVGAQVVGRCWDVAGNASAPYVYALNYDSTPPAVLNHSAEGGDGIVRLRWAVSGATKVEVWRSPGRKRAARSVVGRGPDGTAIDRQVRNGRRYDYRLVALDEAGNVALSTFSATPGRRLLAPASGARLDAPPVLRWTRVRGAEYYNVQLFRGKRKVLSAWPKKPRLALTRAWRFGGDRHRLKPGRRYTWLVWPGRGKRSRNDYGPLIGRGTFTIAAS
jgi:hypothetical protein